MPTVGRLKTRPQFLRVAAAKRKWVTPGLILQAARRQHGTDRAAPDLPAAGRTPEATPDEPEVRVGFTVTRRVGNAVTRNRVKRRLRAAAAEVFPRVGRDGTDYVVIGRSVTLVRPYEKLLQDLEQAVVKLDGKARNRAGDKARGGAQGGARRGRSKEASQ
ncbi:ribonuclease P protein component [Pelagibius sp.]|uniref:ribonuclease P protein component n=1 Tax=Pelagibius sp. TaxID=1931238 RepID=UPI00263973FA|nr:ribonuclease P protein component [Pelagibius sp.]